MWILPLKAVSFSPPIVLVSLQKQDFSAAQADPDLCISGLTAGAFFFGLMVDIIGRKWAFNLTCLITCVFGTLIVSNSVAIPVESRTKIMI